MLLSCSSLLYAFTSAIVDAVDYIVLVNVHLIVIIAVTEVLHLTVFFFAFAFVWTLFW